jgi:hypothetical protein
VGSSTAAWFWEECYSALGQPTQLDQPADIFVGGESQDTARSRIVRILSAAVFARQGLKERINMCLFTLALIDLAYVNFVMARYAHDVYTLLTGNPLLDRPVFAFFAKHNLLFLYAIAAASEFLNAVISTERCICVLFPFHAQKCLPTRALAAVMAVVIPLLVGLCFLQVKIYYFGCFYEVLANSFLEDRSVDGVLLLKSGHATSAVWFLWI